MISVVLVNYNVKEKLLICIDSLTKFKKFTEIIVVDNSEKDEISKELKKRFPTVKYIKSDRNLGYGAGNNLGVKHAKSDYVFILNPDTEIISGSLESLVNYIIKNKNVGAIAPLLVHKDNKPFDKQGVKELTPKRAIFSLSFLSKLFPKNKIYKDYYNVSWNKKSLREVDVVPGTAFLIKKTLFEKIGGFDPNFFLYFEEFDFCRKLKKLGYKNYILPEMKIYHEWGASTAKNKNSSKYFLKSRFYYFKKNFGLPKAFITEFFLRINKYSILLFLIILLALFLRLYRLSEIMAFIGDTAWFFVSAKELLTEGHIPLVGITTSHTWLHQGAFWTYILALILPIVKFNPVGAAYFTVALDIATLVAIYLFAKSYFDQKVALIASLFYATSPFLIISAQIPYHTNPIPFFTILLIFSVLKWIQGNIKYFPIAILLTAILYNFQISILPLGISIFLILIYGFLKKSTWFKKILNKKIIGFSVVAFFIPMLPMLIFDLTHGFSQTLKVGAWMVYRVAVFFGYPPVNPKFGGETWSSFVNFILDYIGRFYFMHISYVALVLFVLSILYLAYRAKESGFKKIELNIILVFTIIPVISYFAAKTNSAAYLPMLFPQLVILFGFLFGSVRNKYFPVSVFIVGIITILNIYSLSKFDRGAHTIDKRIEAAKEIIKQANNMPYNLIMEGPGTQFESTRSNHSYLLWLFGNEPSGTDQKLKFYVEDASDRIIIRKVEE